MTRRRCWSSRLPRCTRPTSAASPASPGNDEKRPSHP
nr:MAG TPA: hypothetical protein [Caudoviricetes sp.]